MALDERKKTAAVRGVKKLLELDTPREEIVSTLKELGLKEEETGEVIAEASRLVLWKHATGEKPGAWEAGTEGGGQAHVRPETPEPRHEGPKPRSHFYGKPKPHSHREAPFWKKVLPFGRSYMPKLRTGGRKKVKEIIVESPLDSQ